MRLAFCKTVETLRLGREAVVLGCHFVEVAEGVALPAGLASRLGVPHQ